jgi:hypothetical protein
MFLKERPGEDLHMGIHLCRGNMSGSTHWVSGSYDKIAEKLFNQTDYETYYLEFDDAKRQGGFEPQRHLPSGKMWYWAWYLRSVLSWSPSRV